MIMKMRLRIIALAVVPGVVLIVLSPIFAATMYRDP